MYEEPMVVPFDADGTLCAILDEKGIVIGTGTREVCEVMIQIVRRLRTTVPELASKPADEAWMRHNVRAAITI